MDHLFLALLSIILYGSEMHQISRKESGAGDLGKAYKMSQTRQAPPAPKEKRSIVGYVAPAVAMAICAFILLLKPVSDLFYYIGAFVGLVAVGLCIWDIIRHYNILATRRLPQFDKQGGDDRA